MSLPRRQKINALAHKTDELGLPCLCLHYRAAAVASPGDVPAAAASIPIATSTPVSASAGPVSPPPLQTTTTTHHHHHHHHQAAADHSGKQSSGAIQYPAVLKGKASPPNPNLVPSGKVPPPVPPRGSVSARGSKSDSSPRGDDPPPAMSMHARRLPTPACLRPPAAPLRPLECRLAIAEEPNSSSTAGRSLHRRNTEFVRAYGPPPPPDELPDEFVSVERVDDSYVIRTSPYPFRPERRRRSGGSVTPCSARSSVDLPKFACHIDPAANSELRDWKMSRKDKKHSETYSERHRRLAQEATTLKSRPIDGGTSWLRPVEAASGRAFLGLAYPEWSESRPPPEDGRNSSFLHGYVGSRR